MKVQGRRVVSPSFQGFLVNQNGVDTRFRDCHGERALGAQWRQLFLVLLVVSDYYSIPVLSAFLEARVVPGAHILIVPQRPCGGFPAQDSGKYRRPAERRGGSCFGSWAGAVLHDAP